MSPLGAWENFYVVVGTAAGALIGLTFVVITLMAETRQEGANWGINSFSTPTVVHFGTVLLVCALLSAPWPSLALAALLLGLCGLGGVGYGAIVVRRLRGWVHYQPVREDWLWYAIVPLAAYTALVATAIMLPGRPVPALFGVGAVILVLLFLGIHNAWDLVIFTAVLRFNPDGESNEGNETDENKD
jgi:hypothetical protein